MVDNSWTKFGNDDPYFAVLTDGKYKIKNLNDQTLDEFFSSGEEHVEKLLRTLKKTLILQILLLNMS